MRIIVIEAFPSPRERFGAFWLGAPRHQPITALLLAAVLKKHDPTDTVKVLDTTLTDGSPARLAEQVRDFAADLICVTVYTHYLAYARLLLDRVKQLSPDIIRICGGPHVSVRPGRLVGDGLSEYCIAGEGEHALIELVTTLKKRWAAHAIRNLVCRHNGMVRVNPPRPLLSDLDELPYPDIGQIQDNISRYRGQILAYRQRPFLAINTARGCRNCCRFCSSVWSPGVIRTHSAEYVLGMVAEARRRYGVREVYFADASFTVCRERVLKICAGLRRMNAGVVWTADCNIDELDAELLGTMKAAGCWMITSGLESGNDRILRSLNKNITVREITATAALVRKAGIWLRGYFMIGLPEDDANTIRETIALAGRLQLLGANFTAFVPVPGSNIFEHLYGPHCEQSPGDPSNFPDGDSLDRYAPPKITVPELIRLHRRAYLTFYLDPRFLVRFARALRSLEDVRKIVTLFVGGFIMLVADRFRFKRKS